MSAILVCASSTQLEALEKIKKKHHKELVKARVTVDLLFASPTLDPHGEPKETHAIIVGGYPADGCCRVTPYRDRVKGLADVEIQIDQGWWDEATKAQRDALIDHELTHIELQVHKKGDRAGEIKTDDLGRPKITMRKHDREFGWFDEVAKRHGQDSHEVEQARTLLHPELRETYQLVLDFSAPEKKPARSSPGRKRAAASKG